jgi:nitronate monooxygenase
MQIAAISTNHFCRTISPSILHVDLASEAPTMTSTNELAQLLGTKYPILLAPMDIVSGSRLTAAVSLAGGFGILGGGYGETVWLERELTELKKMFASSPAPFGIGFITWSLATKTELLEVALSARPRAVMLSFGDPKPFAASIKRAGALLICQVQNEALAEEALAAGADVLVAQGTEAGGHGADRSIFDVVPAIVDLACGRVPVVAAGGIADGRGYVAARALGAKGVLIGTRFYASIEADGAKEAKRRICDAKGEDTVRSLIFDISRNNVWPAPFTGRCLINNHVRRWRGRELEMLQNIEAVAADYNAAKAADNYDIAAVIAGQAVGLINDIPPAATIIERIVFQAREIMSQRHNSVDFGNAEVGT